jgi:hypothetical protein
MKTDEELKSIMVDHLRDCIATTVKANVALSVDKDIICMGLSVIQDYIQVVKRTIKEEM